MQLCLTVFADNVCSCCVQPVIHTHIQRGIETDRETAVCCIELEGAYPEIGQYAIYFRCLVQSQETFHILKVFLYQYKAFIIYCIFPCIFIMVKSNESSVFAQSFQDGPAMAAPAECTIDVNAIGLDVQGVYTLPEQYGNMMISLLHININ
ncbi:hypothetical protein D9M68_821840 [compost metagenome]